MKQQGSLFIAAKYLTAVYLIINYFYSPVEDTTTTKVSTTIISTTTLKATPKPKPTTKPRWQPKPKTTTKPKWKPTTKPRWKPTPKPKTTAKPKWKPTTKLRTTTKPKVTPRKGVARPRFVNVNPLQNWPMDRCEEGMPNGKNANGQNTVIKIKVSKTQGKTITCAL